MEGTVRRGWNNKDRNRRGTRRRWRSEVREVVMEERLREASESAVMRKGDVESCRSLSRDGTGGAKGGGRVEQNVQLQVYEKEFKKVVCPFCCSSQPDKVNMVKHLKGNCRKWNKSLTPSSVCEVQLDQTFSCSLCSYSGRSWENCLVHIYSQQHTKKYTEATNSRDLVQFLFCSCCKVYIPCTYIQIKFHLEHENHKVRSESSLDPNHYLSRGINSIYCLKNNTLRGECLNCPYGSVYNLKGIFQHLQTCKHKTIIQTIYCCLCHEEVYLTEGLYHFISKEHIQKEKQLFLKDDYKLCFYCGFTCETLYKLLWHMKSNCTETRKIGTEAMAKIKKTRYKEEAKAEVAAGCEALQLEDEGKDAAGCEALQLEDEGKDAASRPVNQGEIDERRCILVKADSDVIDLFHVMKKFGKITFVDFYNEEYVVMKFKSQEAVTNISQLQSFIKVNGQKVEIKFF